MLKTRAQKPLKTTEEIRLIAASDTALDPSDDYTRKYLEGDAAALPTLLALRGEPTWLVFRPFNSYEEALLAAEAAGNRTSLDYWTVRLTFVRVEGVEDWEPRYTLWQGLRVLTLESLHGLLSVQDVRHASNRVWAASSLQEEQATPFAS